MVDKQKPSVYIAGPMRGIEHYNAPAFMAAHAELASAGWQVCNPVVNDLVAGVDVYGCSGKKMSEIPTFNIRRAMRLNCIQICEANAIYVLEGWETSEGAQAELALAKMVGLKVMWQVDGRNLTAEDWL